MNLGLVIGLAGGAVGLLAALIAVIVALRLPHGHTSRIPGGKLFRRGPITINRKVMDFPYKPAGYEAPASSEPDHPFPINGDPAAQQWAHGDYGERARTQRGGRIGAVASGVRAWHVFFTVFVIVIIAVVVMGVLGLANMGPLFIGIFAGAAVIAIVFFLVYGRHRATACMRFAQNNGWQYSVSDNSWTQCWFGPPFGIGFNRRATNVVKGEFSGVAFVAFDYFYDRYVNSDRFVNGDRKEADFTVVAYHLTHAVPGIQFTPTSTLGHVERLSQDPFDQAWDVAMPDPASARLLTSPVKDWLMRPDHRHLALRVEGSDLLTWQNNVIAIDSIPTILATLAEFDRLLD